MLPFLIQYYQNHSFYSIIAIVLYFIFYALYGLYIQHFVIIFRPAIYSTFCDNISSSIVWSILSVQCFIVVSPYNKWVLLPPPSRQHVAARHRGSSLFPPFVALCQWFCSDQHLPKVANMRFAQFQLPELSGLAVIMQRSNCDPPWV